MFRSEELVWVGGGDARERRDERELYRYTSLLI